MSDTSGVELAMSPVSPVGQVPFMEYSSGGSGGSCPRGHCTEVYTDRVGNVIIGEGVCLVHIPRTVNVPTALKVRQDLS